MPRSVLVVACVAWLLAALLAVRLVRSALRTRKAPDGLVALFFAGASAAYGAVLVRRVFPGADPALQDGLYQLSLAAFNVPVVAIALFTWRAFRPGTSWAAALALAASGWIVGSHAFAFAFVPWFGPERVPLSVEEGTSVFYWASMAAKAVCFLWAGVEAGVYWRKARRRLALGLAEPLVTNRFLLWAVWSGAAGAILVVRAFSPLFFDAADPTSRVPLPIALGQLVAGIASAGAIWLTFSPPGFYARFVVGRAASSNASSAGP